MGEADWWFDNQPCEADNLVRCSRCKPLDYPEIVYMTRGWSAAFHKSPCCEWLERGQKMVERRGGDPADVESVNIQVALGSGRQACLVCFDRETA